jgi:hypothetical protein
VTGVALVPVRVTVNAPVRTVSTTPHGLNKMNRERKKREKKILKYETRWGFEKELNMNANVRKINVLMFGIHSSLNRSIPLNHLKKNNENIFFFFFSSRV